VPLDRLALAFARLAARHDDAVYGRAPQILADAMTAHPEMVSGEGRSDLELMQAGRGDWVAKIGAEGVQGYRCSRAGIGIAIKVADGSKRALRPSSYRSSSSSGSSTTYAAQRLRIGSRRWCATIAGL
jgi:L-asparaginase II